MEGLQTPQPSGSFFTPLLISMAGIVATSIIIVLYHLVLVKYCRRRHGHNASRASRRRGRPVSESQLAAAEGANGVEKKILEAIPILSYSTKQDSLMFRVDQCECVVCLGELEDGDVVRLLPNCRHVFHVSCIDEWFSGHTSCPICRSPIVPPISSIMIPPSGGDVNGDGDLTVNILPRQVSYHEGGDGCGGGGGGCGGSTSRTQSGELRHCVSLVMPIEERRPRRLIRGLKRSLSMDQSYVFFNRQRDSPRNPPSSSCSSSSSSSIFKSARSVRQLDRVSSMLVRSFSLLKMGRSSTTNVILPY